MAYTTTQLITNSFYLSQIVSRDLQTVSGAQLQDGLDMLNALLNVKSAHSRLIPYYQEYQFNAVPNQETYFVPNLVVAETLTFNIGPVRYSMSPMSRKPYQGSGRVDNIASLPFNWHFERGKGGGTIWLYFLPNTNYPMTLWGKFGFTNVTLGQDLTTVFDLFYIDYLRYRLAQRICSEYGINMSPQAEQELRILESEVTDVSPADLSLNKCSSLGATSGLNWGDINIGRGYRPM